MFLLNAKQLSLALSSGLVKIILVLEKFINYHKFFIIVCFSTGKNTEKTDPVGPQNAKNDNCFRDKKEIIRDFTHFF